MSDDLRFDALLTEGAGALLPAPDVSPWRTAMSCIMGGIALKTLTLQILYLHYILPTLGCILLVLGFRTLRRENRALRWPMACPLPPPSCAASARCCWRCRWTWDWRLPMPTVR